MENLKNRYSTFILIDNTSATLWIRRSDDGYDVSTIIQVSANPYGFNQALNAARAYASVQSLAFPIVSIESHEPKGYRLHLLVSPLSIA